MHTATEQKQIPAPDVYDSSFGEFEEAERTLTYAQHHKALMQELIDSIIANPAAEVRTPGFTVGTRMTATEVVEDLLAGKDSEAETHALMRVLGRCAAGKMDHETHLLASGLLASLARKHANFHADEA
jgi:hypothetical protein